jgi:hypothetical protein
MTPRLIKGAILRFVRLNFLSVIALDNVERLANAFGLEVFECLTPRRPR